MSYGVKRCQCVKYCQSLGHYNASGLVEWNVELFILQSLQILVESACQGSLAFTLPYLTWLIYDFPVREQGGFWQGKVKKEVLGGDQSFYNWLIIDVQFTMCANRFVLRLWGMPFCVFMMTKSSISYSCLTRPLLCLNFLPDKRSPSFTLWLAKCYKVLGHDGLR